MSSAVTQFVQEVEPIRLKVEDVPELEPGRLKFDVFDVFEGKSPDPDAFRVFGGWLVAQALAAAGGTVDADRVPHSLHTSFLRPADATLPLTYEVTRTLQGRTLSHRQVDVLQAGKVVVHLVASFRVARPETPFDHGPGMPAVPTPETLPTLAERLGALERPLRRPGFVRRNPVDIRFVEPPTWADETSTARPPHNALWCRADGELPDSPLLHACAIAYATDLTILDTLVLPHAATLGPRWIPRASLDHAIRFHRPFRADRWWLYDQEGTTLHAAHGTVHGRLFDATGTLFATVSQEALFGEPVEHR
ncbi:acyl-CoA thioesterase [Embleya sp. NBC_00896]|uniref:acyl-CoA thioesterase n=1 Tax=Embleya sp. NBC_00896 TaxID=2975961 RepID=UPI003866AD6A|nr:thioesterase family protein [Embleya sp. NBC_00896]